MTYGARPGPMTHRTRLGRLTHETPLSAGSLGPRQPYGVAVATALGWSNEKITSTG